MPQAAVLPLGFAVVAFILLAPLHRGFIVLVAATFLTPPQLTLAGGVIGGLSIGRVALIAALLSLAMRLRSGEVSWSALTLTPVHVAFGVFVSVALALGVANAIPSLRAGSLLPWWNVVDQFLFFVFALVVARTTEEGWIVRVVAAILVISAAIGIFEYTTGRSWGHLLGRELPEQVPFRRRRSLVGGLVLRGGEVRGRAGAEFALAFGWVSVILLPAIIAAFARARRWLLWLPLFAVCILGITISFSRSVMLALPFVLLLMLVVSRFHTRIVVLIVAGAIAAGITAAAVPSLIAPFDSESTRGSSQGRGEKLPVALDLVSESPLTGIGFRGLEEVRVGGLDNGYLLAYSTFGAIGAAVLIGLLAVAGGSVFRGVRGSSGSDFVYPAMAFAGTTAGVAGAAAFDEFALQASPKAVWLMVALGIAFAERRVGYQRVLQRPTRRRLLIPVAATFLGLVVLLAAPSHTAVQFRFGTLASGWESRGRGLMTFPGTVLARTVCSLVPALGRIEPDARIDCREDFRRGIAGFGVVRIQTATPARTEEVATSFRRLVESYVPTFQPYFGERMRSGRPSWAKTAPVWMGIGGLFVALFAPRPGVRPGFRWRRSRAAFRSRLRSAQT